MKHIGSLLFFALILSLNGCSELTNSSQFNDSHVQQNFIEKLDENKIRYRVSEDRKVFYAADAAEKVKEIESEIQAKYYPGCTVSFSDKNEFKLMTDKLKEKGIPFSVVELDAGPTITCAPKYRDDVYQLMKG